MGGIGGYVDLERESYCRDIMREEIPKKYPLSNKATNGNCMKRFLESFYEYETSTLVKRINEYAERHGLQIISVATNENQHGAVVLFEGNKPKY